MSTLGVRNRGAGSALKPKLAAEDFAPTQRPPLEASILPLSCYSSPEFFELEMERIFMKEWLCVGRTDQVAKPGDYVAFDLLGEPLVLVRDEGETIRVLSRVCRHRSMMVVEGEGNRRSFECPYHAWTYALGGKLIGAPEMQQTKNFDRTTCRLPALRVETWENFIFVNFDPDAAPLGRALARLSERVKNYKISEMRSTTPLVYECNANWKVMVENFQEFYHVQGLHREPLEAIMPARLSIAEDIDEAYAYIHLKTVDPDAGLSGGNGTAPFPPLEGLSPEERKTHPLVLVYPGTVGLWIAGDCMAFYQMLPEAVDRTIMRVTLCVPPATMERPGFTESLKQAVDNFESVNNFDLKCCQAVHRGFASRMGQRGRLSHMELCIWQIHRYILRRVLDGEAAG